MESQMSLEKEYEAASQMLKERRITDEEYFAKIVRIEAKRFGVFAESFVEGGDDAIANRDREETHKTPSHAGAYEYGFEFAFELILFGSGTARALMYDDLGLELRPDGTIRAKYAKAPKETGK